MTEKELRKVVLLYLEMKCLEEACIIYDSVMKDYPVYHLGAVYCDPESRTPIYSTLDVMIKRKREAEKQIMDILGECLLIYIATTLNRDVPGTVKVVIHWNSVRVGVYYMDHNSVHVVEGEPLTVEGEQND